jgi:amino acid transporter
VIAVASFNIFCAKHLPLAEGIFCSVHIFSFVPVIVCLWVMTPTKQSAAAVFTQFTNNGAGWPNMGATVLVGQVCRSYVVSLDGCLLTVRCKVSSMFVVLGQDSVAHMAEEVENAGTIVPKAMV